MDLSKYEEDLIKAVEELENEKDAEYEEIPLGNYEVKIDRMEVKDSKKASKMLSIWFRILEGTYKGQIIFYNQVLENQYGIRFANVMLKSLCEGNISVNFQGFSAYEDLTDRIKNYVDNNKLEYELAYSENKKGFKEYKIIAVFEG